MTSRTKFIVGSAVVVVAFVGVSVAVYVGTDGDFRFTARAGAAVLVVALTGFGLLLRAKPSRRAAMQSCVLCHRKIIYEHEGDFCDVCDAAVHGKCLGEHRANAHATAEKPYR